MDNGQKVNEKEKMMESLFMCFLTMSYQASFVVCFVLVARVVLKLLHAPKKYSYYMWFIPFIRMILPVTIESIFSLLPNESASIQDNSIYQLITPAINIVSTKVNAPNTTSNIALNQGSMVWKWSTSLQWAWLIGVCVFLLINLIYYVKLNNKLQYSIRLMDNIYLSDHINTSFVFGILNARIYLGTTIQKEEMPYIISHEKKHVKRGDHLIKLLSFLILSLHWFNPFAWIAFLCMERDMEMSCDEMVMLQFDRPKRKEYAKALLNVSIGGKRVTGAPISFGDGNTEERIKNIMNDKKPTIWIGLIAIVLLICLTIGLLTNPIKKTRNSVGRKEVVQSEDTKEVTKDSKIVNKKDSIDITPPSIEKGMNLGADGVVLDFANEDYIIFHGYFGLFVYSIPMGKIIGAVDLESIGCNMTQGDRYCEVSVLKDASHVYLHPISETDMYVYNVYEQTLWKEPYTLEGKELFDSFSDNNMIGDIYVGNKVEFVVDGYQYYGYLFSEDGSIENLNYIEDDMLISLFADYFNSIPTNSGESIKEWNLDVTKISATGGIFTIQNNSDQVITYGEQYTLQVKRDDKWVDVPYIIQDWGFHDIGYTIKANDSVTMEVDWQWLYGKLPVGNYQFIKEIQVQQPDDSYEAVQMEVEFLITE